MIKNRNGNGNGRGNGHGDARTPSDNGDPFKSFVVAELLSLREFREEQAKRWGDQQKINTVVLDQLASLLARTDASERRAQARERRQEKLNRLIIAELQAMRRERRK